MREADFQNVLRQFFVNVLEVDVQIQSVEENNGTA